MWRRWTDFCERTGSGDDPFLTVLSIVERELMARAFLNFYRTADWDIHGRFTGHREKPMVAGSLRQAAGNLATSFRINFRESPMHVTGTPHLLPSIRALLQASDNVNPPTRRQKAINPKLLRALFTLSGDGTPLTIDIELAVVADLAI